MSSKAVDLKVIQRSVLLELLRKDRDELWFFERLCKSLHKPAPEVILEAVEVLTAKGAVEMVGVATDKRIVVWAADGVRHVDALGLICV